MSEQKLLYTFYQNSGKYINLKYRKDRKSYTKRIDFYKPSIYFPSKSSDPNLPRTMFGKPVEPRTFETLSEARSFVYQYKDVDGMTWDGNSDFAQQFLIELYDGQVPTFDPADIRKGITDIEVHTKTFPDPKIADKPINACTIHDSYTDTYYLFSNNEYVREHRRSLGWVDEAVCEPLYVHYKNDPDVGMLNVVYREFNDEPSLLRAMCEHYNEFQYDITSGWNSKGFDMLYIVNRCYKVLGEEYTKTMLSPFNKITLVEGFDENGRDTTYAKISGSPHVDYQLAYKKHIYEPRDSYSLDNIAFEELGENKLEHEESLYRMHLDRPRDFNKYNIKDVKLIKQLDDKLKLFDLTATLAYFCMCNYEDTIATVKPWENLIARHMYIKNIVPPFHKKIRNKEEFEGAFVKEVLAGFYEWLVAFDFNSLYPMIEIQNNIGSETYIPRHQLPAELRRLKDQYTVDDLVEKRVDLSSLKDTNYAMTANFEFYDKAQKSIIASIKDELYALRKTYKKKMLAAESRVELIKEELKRRRIAFE